MRNRLLLSSLALSVLSVAPACGGDDPPGGLVVPFRIGAGVECSVLGVTEVTVALVTPSASGAEGSAVAEETVACEDKEAIFTGIAPGVYELHVTGVDAEGVVIVDNFDKNPADRGEVTSGAENTADTVELRPTPAKIHVRWQFNDGFSMCSDVPVKKFLVSAYEKAGTSKLLDYTFDCDPEEDTVGGYNVVLDPDRAIAGDDLELITIDPVDANGKSLVPAPLQFQMEPPGLGRTVKLTARVNCEGDKCTIACAPGKNADDMKPNLCLAD
ncbi:MAG TPA: hypothetical protein VIK91_18490 [Nannocystis sp.]